MKKMALFFAKKYPQFLVGISIFLLYFEMFFDCLYCFLILYKLSGKCYYKSYN